MASRLSIVVALAALVVGSAACWASPTSMSLTPEAIMRGNAVVAVPGLSAAWYHNPAGLPALTITPAEGGVPNWRYAINASRDAGGQKVMDAYNAAFGKDGCPWAVGFGFNDFGSADVNGVGIGYQLPGSLPSIGVSYKGFDPAVGDVVDTYDVGLLKGFNVDLFGGSRAMNLGFVVRDVTDERQITYDLGFSACATRNVQVFADCVDLSDEIDTIWRYGAVYTFGDDLDWQLGLGSDDDQATAGVTFSWDKGPGGSQWQAGLAWKDMGGDDAVVFGITRVE